ncbi:MAG: hypothetical protein AAF609_12045 [Cyanobacteria bacterium P01_C01_bin.120]
MQKQHSALIEFQSKRLKQRQLTVPVAMSPTTVSGAKACHGKF